MNKIFLENLPKKDGWGKLKDKKVIDWKNSIGYKVKGIYKDIEFEVEIVDYKERYLYVKYLNNDIFKIFCDNFKNGNLGSLLKKITTDFKIEIGSIFQDDKRNITVTDMEYRDNPYNEGKKFKYYRYTCNNCGWTEGWMVESSLNKGIGCSCCSGHNVVEGINDIPTTAPFMVKYFQGGYDEAKLYTKWGSGNQNNKGGKIHAICPDCGQVKDKKISIQDIYKNNSIGCFCSDKIPYPEKAMFSILKQLKLNFKTQVSKEVFSWIIDNKRYDFSFVFNNEQFLIETHGIQHYEQSSRGRSLEEEQENDKLKKELALANGIKEENYIVIDCRYSNLDWIKNNDNGILNSRLNELFDLNNINWLKVEEFTCINLVKEACNLKRNNDELTIIEISEIIGYSRSSVYNWITKGFKLGWCDYDPQKEKEKRNKTISDINKKRCSKSVEIFKNGLSLGVFVSGSELAKQSKELFGIKLIQSMISQVCTGKRKSYYGFVFKYV